MGLRLITFADAAGSRAGVLLDGGRVLDLGAAMPPARDMIALIEAGPAALAEVRALAADPPAGAVLPLAAVALQAPIPRPRRNVFCVGRNYMDHVAEGDRTRGITQSEVPKYPQFFTKAADTVVAPGATVPSHAGVTKWLDYEVELVAVIGRAGADIPKERALEHVFGWTIGNDVTGRDLQRRHGQWFKGKSLDRSCPLGPVIVPREDLDASDLAIGLKINGEQRQASRTSKMIFDVAEIIHQLSAGFTLLPGDVILTGTPEGVGYAMQPPQTLKPGDVMELTIEGIGTLTNTIGA
ncbi:2-keto-4-pentenoate hydratase/2-oxohepta-3-ene-1,7-dioic acid hydratase in catechol pathway [Roseomonas alkaliterrae]|uniref:2-keto-4-pentenoate hydratase/2-oxohepta-3-ene-1,7-dioic acid hydratase in catechol pathway n=3 Tax=Neoroseomonas alkaliterrae TaxID=1452450 RepID=A0A840Y9B8_9PROT|nr:fumarylacetoacetate hydrolase family protein [Neoroseomonas alkaliterrae]MBB5690464.1 2-keto-4-pentenoate hydratase/2-oxohepta-3-ene-1,7-dioic acid hydratase in catechol pathway [Neoroseomonas alkaliterrae]